MTDKYFVQETIGGWKQNAIYSGTYDECLYFEQEHNLNSGTSSFAIVHESEYVVDYL